METIITNSSATDQQSDYFLSFYLGADENKTKFIKKRTKQKSFVKNKKKPQKVEKN